jgi:glutathione peroxidase-type tryparedoxin peroxidase
MRFTRIRAAQFTSIMTDAKSVAKTENPTSIHDFIVVTNKKKPYDLAELKGSAVLIMNVASQCGYTQKGYSAATELYTRYKDHGFTVLAFPCNQFGGQEPGTNEDIEHFACTKFKAEFPIMDKVEVNGGSANPLWEFMKKEKTGLLGTTSVKWNFTSFLCDPSGKVVARYSPGTAAKDIEKDLRPILPKKAEE